MLNVINLINLYYIIWISRNKLIKESNIFYYFILNYKIITHNNKFYYLF